MKRVMKKCYIYTRVSTAIQVDGYSLDAQKEKLRKYADFQDMKVVAEYSDEGKSGKNVEGRVQFKQMLQDIQDEKDDIQYVLVFKLSRFGRNAADVLNSVQMMQDYGVNLICVEDGIDSSKDAGKLMISVLSAVAEIERENILVQTMEGRRQKAREGKWNGGFAPYGYELKDGNLLIKEEEAVAIRKIFELFTTTTLGVRGVAKYLNDYGYEKVMRHNNKSKLFSTEFVRKVIDNPVYCGKIAYGRRTTEKVKGKRNVYHTVKQSSFPIYEGQHEAIVSEEVWNAANDKRMKTSFKHEKIHDLEHEHILSGILKCPVCGAPMYSNSRRKNREDGTPYKAYYYYSCKHRLKVDGEACSYNKQWSEEKVDKAVIEAIQSLVHNPKFAQSIKDKIVEKIDISNLEKDRDALLANRERLIGAKNRLAVKLDQLDVNDKYYDQKFDDMEARLDNFYTEIGEVEERIAAVNDQIHVIRQQEISEKNVFDHLLYFDEYFEKFTDKEKKEFINSFLRRVELKEKPDENGKFLKLIEFKFPVYYNGQDIIGIDWDKKNRLECVVLMSRKDK